MFGPIRDYRDLVAWQQAIELAVECRGVTRRLPRSEWELASQLRRASTSVHLSIAEGNGRPTLVDYVKYLGNAQSSLNEVGSALHFIERNFSGNSRDRCRAEARRLRRKAARGIEEVAGEKAGK